MATLRGTTVFLLERVGFFLPSSPPGAGFCQVIATNPMEITKIRMQVQATLPPEQRTGLLAGTFFPLLIRAFSVP